MYRERNKDLGCPYKSICERDTFLNVLIDYCLYDHLIFYRNFLCQSVCVYVSYIKIFIYCFLLTINKLSLPRQHNSQVFSPFTPNVRHNTRTQTNKQTLSITFENEPDSTGRRLM